MLLPSIFEKNLFDDFFGFDYPSRSFQRAGIGEVMKTDIKESDTGYELDISLPGYKKEDVKAELKDGYLTISATTSGENSEKDDKSGTYIRRERYSGACSRNFYVGTEVNDEDINAKFQDGILKLYVPKIDVKPAVEEKKYITIE